MAIDVSFTEDALRVVLADGREISAPLQWFPRLLDATSEQWELIGDGIGIRWPQVDEDAMFMPPQPTAPERFDRRPA